MTDYIKFPSFPAQDLLQGVKEISPYPRVDPQQPHQQGYERQQPGNQKETEQQVRRRFLSLRQLINKLQKIASITKVDYLTAGTELHGLGLANVEEQLIDQLLQLKIPLESIEQLLQQIDQRRSAVTLGNGRRIVNQQPDLFPVSAEGLSEYNLKIEDLQIRTGPHSGHIAEKISTDGFYIVEQNRLRLTFSRLAPTDEVPNDLLKLKISALLAVIETDESDRRAILYPRPDNSYALYADKQINMSI